MKKNAKKKADAATERRDYERATRRMELDLIRERLALAPEERMNFLRVRLPGGGSTL